MRSLTLALLILFLVVDAASSQTDFFYSFRNLGDGATNNSAQRAYSIGQTGEIYLYFSPFQLELEQGKILNIDASTSGVISIANAESLEFDVILADPPGDEMVTGPRWGDAFGPAVQVEPDSIFNLFGLNIVSGFGMTELTTGEGPFLDLGYDTEAAAFLFARIEFETIGAGQVDLLTSVDPICFPPGADVIVPSLGEARIIVTEFLLGDLDGDGSVTLLDVPLFINLLQKGGFQEEADFDLDGVITLLDVDGFVTSIGM